LRFFFKFFKISQILFLLKIISRSHDIKISRNILIFVCKLSFYQTFRPNSQLIIYIVLLQQLYSLIRFLLSIFVINRQLCHKYHDKLSNENNEYFGKLTFDNIRIKYMENSNIRGSDPGPNISRKISTCCPNSFFFR
jgi:hypothetical protein